jgi:hypothetical protein
MPPAVLDARKYEKIAAEAIRADISDIAEYLQKRLGQKMTAYIGGLKDPKEVGSWIAEETTPRDKTATRLRYAYQAARMLIDAYGAATAKAWFFGMNPKLGDEAPAYVLRYADTPEDMRSVVPAARAFAGMAE